MPGGGGGGGDSGGGGGGGGDLQSVVGLEREMVEAGDEVVDVEDCQVVVDYALADVQPVVHVEESGEEAKSSASTTREMFNKNGMATSRKRLANTHKGGQVSPNYRITQYWGVQKSELKFSKGWLQTGQ
ncbi:hypothetical protein HYDPIDRAFT_170953 [Hydnomerulius pinastri MD-312]|uniref:Unplaced genomic scaffold scaffold_62, whole genome shotgun sequence n=1 Tax=Hydnomerulius pinastri MD-312 TaxID=994086 RepID=A0A0C9V1K5_9AGAM|nr:hypothetical protein HYDPIDRAFT_170953 [Hydnomerulius pinastri MD-312]